MWEGLCSWLENPLGPTAPASFSFLLCLGCHAGLHLNMPHNTVLHTCNAPPAPPTAAHFLPLFLCLFQTASLVRRSHWKPGPFLFFPALVSSRHAQLTLCCISLSQPSSCQQNVSSTGTGILSSFCCFLRKQRDTYCKPIEWINSGIWSSCTRGVEDKGIY